jgi:hypothetical protein
MIPLRGLSIHGAILLVATLLAFHTWNKDDTKEAKPGETELWPGTPEQLKSLRFESKMGFVTLEPREDANGRYFIGSAKKSAEAMQPPKKDDNASTPAPPPEPPKLVQFISGKEGQELVESLAPLRALRVLGKVTDAQKVDFGFDKDEGKLTVKIGSTEHKLVFGGPTPGGSDYYVKDAATGNGYVVAGSIYRDLTSADQKLVEHNLHGFESSAVERIKITAGTSSRELIRSASKKDAWTKPSAPNDKDETATNFVAKIDRLHTMNYSTEKLDPPAAPSDLIVRVDYFDDKKPLGFLELVRRPGEKADKPDYVARTEHTRWYATVIRSSAEQIDQDVKSVLTP